MLVGGSNAVVMLLWLCYGVARWLLCFAIVLLGVTRWLLGGCLVLLWRF